MPTPIPTDAPPHSSDDPPPRAADERARAPAPSPCVGVCRLVERDGHCAGCLRTLSEIAGWGRLDEPARHALLDVLAERRRAAAASAPPSAAASGPG